MKLLTSLLVFFTFSTAIAAPLSESEVWINSKTWEIAFNSGNAEALTQLYSDDAIVVPPSLEILNAREQIKGYWNQQIVNGTDNYQLQTINLRSTGDTIYQSAVWVATVTSNGVATELEGEMTNVIAKQADGSWKIQLQSWN